MRSTRALPFLFLVSAASAFGACGSPPAPVTHPPVAASASASSVAATPDAPDGPMPKLRTGSLPAKDHPEPLAGTVTSMAVADGMETLEIAAMMPHSDVRGYYDIPVVSMNGSRAYCFADRPSDPSKPTTLWIRRPAAAAGTPVVADLYFSSVLATPGDIHHVHADDPAGKKQDPEVVGTWERAFANAVAREYGGHSAWQTYARLKILSIAPPEKKAPVMRPHGGNHAPPVRAQPMPVRHSTDELAVLMDTGSGALAVQQALQNDRPLLLAAAREKRTLQVSALPLPDLSKHPWPDMIRRLGVKAPAEPLADAVPAEFYYLRASSFDAMIKVLDQVDTFGTPAAHALSSELADHQLATRYEASLGLSRGPLARAFGGKVISEIALVGSDPYVKEGTDLTAIFRVKDHALFNTGLVQALADHATKHGAISQSKTQLSGVDVLVAKSADGAVRQERATINDLEIVSNSPGAITRVIQAVQGKHARLSAEPDFQYMLARDASTRADVLAYAGDRFVTEVVGPRQKIAEARRQIALGDLMTPGFSAMLYGFMYGKSPDSVNDLFHAKLLDKSDLVHTDGTPISWNPGKAAQSTWGTPAELVPLIDLPAVDVVTESEKESYARFARSYQYDWTYYVDPIAARLALQPAGDHTDLTIDVRELPLSDSSDYSKIQDEAGDARFDAAGIPDGARVVVGIGAESKIRSLVEESRHMIGNHDLKFDWLGDWGAVGVLDRSSVADAVLELDHQDVSQMPPADDQGRTNSDDDIVAISKVPFYAEIAVKNPLGATLALTALRTMANESAPGMVDWGQHASYRGAEIVRVSVDSKKAKDEFKVDVNLNVYYSLTQGALIAALSEPTLRRLIDDRLDGRGPKTADAPAKGAPATGSQFSMEGSSDAGHAVWSVLAWMIESDLVRHDASTSMQDAEAVLRGAPDHADDAKAVRDLELAYLGFIPLAPDGGTFTLGKDGPVDPARGTEYSPIWPQIPVPGSPVEALMRGLGHARADLSFDDEGPAAASKSNSRSDQPARMQSLHARVTTRIAN